MAAEFNRVRELLRYMKYGDLRKNKILPSTPFFTRKDIPKGGKTPKIATIIGFPSYGLFVEGLIGMFLEKRDASVEDIIKVITLIHPQYANYIKPEDYTEIAKLVRNHFEDLPILRAEWTRGPVQGHPDIVYKDTVYDIKTTSNFDMMRSETILQLLSYFCLAQLEYPDGRIKKIGLVLPTQKCILTVNLSEWEWEEFWDELKLCVNRKKERESLYICDASSYISFMTRMKIYVGHTVYKENLFQNVIDESLGPAGCRRAKQFFVRGRSDSNVTVSDSFTKELKDTLNSVKNIGREVPVFIHSPYTLNIANPWGNDKRIDDSKNIPWTCERLISLLKFGEECGIKGVVVHFGQHRQTNKKIKLKDGKTKVSKPMPLSTAIINMFSAVNIVAENVSGNCVLLLETPAGESGELCSDRDELISFFLSMPPETRKKVKLCVDTCHVLSAGYDPYDYVKEVHLQGIEIGLFHYNDSYYPKGCRNDCHASIGSGYVGFQSLSGVLDYAMEYKIPCVYE